MPERNYPGYYRPPSEWGQQTSGGFDVPSLPWADMPQQGDIWGSLWQSPNGMEEYSVSTMPSRLGNEMWGAAQGAGQWAQNMWDQWRQPQPDAITQASPWAQDQYGRR